jgi:HSP20 family protein
MARWRSNGGHPFSQLRDDVDRLMGDFFGASAAVVPRTWAAVRAFPAVNVWEDGEQLWAEAEVPGLKTEDVDISVAGDELTIRGRRPEPDAQATSFHRRERGAGDFSRTLRLPYEVEAEGVEATLRDGVLTIKLPKAASARPRKIQVSGGN